MVRVKINKRINNRIVTRSMTRIRNQLGISQRDFDRFRNCSVSLQRNYNIDRLALNMRRVIVRRNSLPVIMPNQQQQRPLPPRRASLDVGNQNPLLDDSIDEFRQRLHDAVEQNHKADEEQSDVSKSDSVNEDLTLANGEFEASGFPELGQDVANDSENDLQNPIVDSEHVVPLQLPLVVSPSKDSAILREVNDENEYSLSSLFTESQTGIQTVQENDCESVVGEPTLNNGASIAELFAELVQDVVNDSENDLQNPMVYSEHMVSLQLPLAVLPLGEENDEYEYSLSALFSEFQIGENDYESVIGEPTLNNDAIGTEIFPELVQDTVCDSVEEGATFQLPLADTPSAFSIKINAENDDNEFSIQSNFDMGAVSIDPPIGMQTLDDEQIVKQNETAKNKKILVPALFYGRSRRPSTDCDKMDLIEEEEELI